MTADRMAVGQQLVIESEVAGALSTELAQLTVKSVTDVVAAVLQKKVECARERANRFEEAKRLIDELQSHWLMPGSSSDIDELYGEDGLPA